MAQKDWIPLEITHPTTIFERQMAYVARKYRSVTLDEVLGFAKGTHDVPANAVAVTFDDGYADNFNVAFPILERFGIKAAFYVTVSAIGDGIAPWFCRVLHAFQTSSAATWTDPVDKRIWDLASSKERHEARMAACKQCATITGDSQREAVESLENALSIDHASAESQLMMTWEQVRNLVKAGHVVGSHTLTHPNLAFISGEDCRAELSWSKRTLEQHVGTTVNHFSYPNPILQPHYDDVSMQAVEKEGYRTAVTSTSGVVRRDSNVFALNRIAVPESFDEFRWKLEAPTFGLGL